MRILAFPKNGIAYNECFYRALEARGVEVLEGVFSGGWLSETVRPGDWLHLHWPSFSYAEKRGRAKLLLRFSRFVALLLLAKAKGAHIAWTAHNLLPHDPCAMPWLDVLGRHIVIRLSGVILVHGPAAAAVLADRFPAVREKTVLIPHGHWIGHYPASITSAEARTRLGIPEDAYTYLFIGLCKPYKNLEGLIQAFRLQNENAVLVIAGHFQSPEYHARIHALAADDPRIRIHAGFVPDHEMQTFLLASNVVVAPYREILTSGTALLALSFGRPIVSIDRGFLRDVVSVETGLLYAPDAPQGLYDALRDVREIHFDGERILSHARRFSFEQAADVCIAAFARTEGHARPTDLPTSSKDMLPARAEAASRTSQKDRR